MNLKLKVLPFVISVIVSSALLFGGWFIYSSMALKTPLSQIVQESAGVEQASLNITREQVMIDMTLDTEANLREIVHHIKDEGQSVLGQRELRIQVLNDAIPELEQWWSTALFDVAQAMETKQYGHIPTALEARQSQLPGLHIDTQMDQHVVYVKLSYDGNSKFIMLPRMSNQLEVWGDE